MQTVIIVIHLMIVVGLVGVVLLQKSEGGGLGIGGTGGFLTSRGTANVLTRTTAIPGGGLLRHQPDPVDPGRASTASRARSCSAAGGSTAPAPPGSPPPPAAAAACSINCRSRQAPRAGSGRAAGAAVAVTDASRAG